MCVALTCLAICVSCQSLSWARDGASTMPSAQSVVERFVQVTGGREAYSSIQTRRMSGTVEVHSSGIKGTTTVLITPTAGKIQSDLPGVGTSIQGYNGDVAYYIDPSTGPRILTGREREVCIQQLTVNAEISLDGFASAEVVGIENVGKSPCYKLELKSPAGDISHRYFDVDSGLLRRTVAPSDASTGTLMLRVSYDDYNTAPPIKRSMKTVLLVGDPSVLTIETRYDKVEHNVEISPAELELPDSIKALLPTTQPK
jgi:hypothetical protein